METIVADADAYQVREQAELDAATLRECSQARAAQALVDLLCGGVLEDEVVNGLRHPG